MKALEKIIALLMVMAITVGCLASCSDKNEGANDGKENQGQETQSDRYAANIEIKFATNDDKMKDVVYSLDSSKSTLYVDGDKLMLDSATELDGISLNDNYVYLDGVIYHKTLLTAGGKSSSVSEKANMAEDNIDKLLSDLGTGANIGVGDFENYEMTGEDGNYTFVCSDINDSASASLCGIFASKFSGLNATVALEGADYTLVTEKDRDANTVLSCHFAITMNGQTYKITMHIYCNYSYDAEVNILAPTDADSYASVSYEEILK